jgi:hypothetical protein
MQLIRLINNILGKIFLKKLDAFWSSKTLKTTGAVRST